MAYDRILDPTGYHARKAERAAHFRAAVFGWRLRRCGGCAGSGWYDGTNRWGRSLKCGCCAGTGKERYQAHQLLPTR